MKKDLFRKTLVLVMCCSFIGASVLPSLSRDVLTRVVKAGDGEKFGSVSMVAEGYLDISPARKLARTSDGVLHCVYNRTDGGVSQIYHAYSIDNGETWSEEALTSENYNQTNPSIAVDSNDYLHVVWAGCHSDSPEHPQIRYRKYTTTWQEIVNITTDTEWDQRTPAIAVDSNDYLHVVWQKVDCVGGTWCQHGCGPIYYSKYTDSWSTPILIGEDIHYNEINPIIVVDGDDNLHVAWDEGGDWNWDCWHSAYRQYTTSWQPVESFECYVRSISMVVSDNEVVHLASNYGAYSTEVQYRKRTDSEWSDPEIVAPSTYTVPRKYPSIAIDSNSGLHVIWNDDGNIKYRRKTTGWSDIETLVSDDDSIYPNFIWSYYPVVDGVHTNIPKNGFAFVWNDGSTIKFYKSDDLEWETPSNHPPVADAGGPYSGFVGEEIVFDASGSYDVDGDTLEYRWDFNNDGTWDTDWLSDPVTTHVYDSEFHGQAKLEVKDGRDSDDDIAEVDIEEIITSFYFVHLTDTHVEVDNKKSVGAVNRLKRTLDHIRSFSQKPAFVVISGDLVDRALVPNYNEFIKCFYKGEGYQLYLDPELTVPVYICPGNHDYRVNGWPGIQSLISYECSLVYPNEVEHCYNIYFENPPIQIVSVNSGDDRMPWDQEEEPWDPDIYPPESKGLFYPVKEWLGNVLNPNNFVILFMHHPPINWDNGPLGPHWDDGIFINYKEWFLDVCENNHIGLVLNGHTHENKVYTRECDHNDDFIWGIKPDRMDEQGRKYYLTYSGENFERTLFVQTAATCEMYAYRNISVIDCLDLQEIRVYTAEFATESATGRLIWHVYPCFTDSPSKKIANLHVYTSEGKHLGVTENGTIESQIDGGYYSFLVDFNNTTCGQVASVNYGQNDYIFEIEGLSDGIVDFECRYFCGKLIGEISTRYNNISVKNGSIGKLYVKKGLIDYTLYMDDDGDGVVDRKIQPSSWKGNDTTPPRVEILKPMNALYINNNKVLSLPITVVFGSIEVEVQAVDNKSGINRVEFYVDNELRKTDTISPYSWTWREQAFFKHSLKVIVYDNAGNNATVAIPLWKFF